MVMTALAVFMLNKVLLSMQHLKPRLIRLASNSKLVPRIFSAMSSPDQAPPWKATVCEDPGHEVDLIPTCAIDVSQAPSRPLKLPTIP